MESGWKKILEVSAVGLGFRIVRLTSSYLFWKPSDNAELSASKKGGSSMVLGIAPAIRPYPALQKKPNRAAVDVSRL